MSRFMTTFSILLAASMAIFASPSHADERASIIQGNFRNEPNRNRCADPNMTDDERSAIISASVESAVECMGEDWVWGGMDTQDLLHDVSTRNVKIDVDVAARRVRLWDREGKMHLFLASPGTPGRDTLTGRFHGPFRIEGANYKVQSRSKSYRGAPMPYAIFYRGGYAIHGTHAENMLGKPASHGCVRLSVKDAKYVHDLVKSVNGRNVSIFIHGRVPRDWKQKEQIDRKLATPGIEVPETQPQTRILETAVPLINDSRVA
jgi:hypothetical protein